MAVICAAGIPGNDYYAKWGWAVVSLIGQLRDSYSLVFILLEQRRRLLISEAEDVDYALVIEGRIAGSSCQCQTSSLPLIPTFVATENPKHKRTLAKSAIGEHMLQ